MYDFRKISVIFIMITLIGTTNIAVGNMLHLDFHSDVMNNNSIRFDLSDLDESCAGIVATGVVVKDNRSIFWKQRHVSDPTGNKPYFFQGDNYKYYGIGSPSGTHTKMGINEAGLALGSFTASSPKMSPENRQYLSDGIKGPADARHYVLGVYSTVKEAALYLAKHTYISESLGGINVGIVSSEFGVGAIVSNCYVGGNTW